MKKTSIINDFYVIVRKSKRGNLRIVDGDTNRRDLEYILDENDAIYKVTEVVPLMLGTGKF